jgi:hypothetical protein
VVYRYRLVPYGTCFQRSTGLRDREPIDPKKLQKGEIDEQGETCLFDNEIVADVGGSWENSGEPPYVFDHHFDVANQFPSAAAAVLHHMEAVAEWACQNDGRTVWLVTHQSPDFDALASLYLIRSISKGELAHGWQERFAIESGSWTDLSLPDGTSRPRINWYEPRVSPYDIPSSAFAWAILIAAYASRVDQSKPLTVPRARAIHSVLYAGQKRGRWSGEGAVDFFDEVKRVIREEHLNPILDDVAGRMNGVGPELALLQDEEERYMRDLRRARKSVVTVPVQRFDAWFRSVKDTPLLNSSDETDLLHAGAGAENQRQVDAIWIRDPESLLFKEWARNDLLNSPMGRGFIFTAVANTNGKPAREGTVDTEYFFALDPERAGEAHLYPVWARLQTAELAELERQKRSDNEEKRNTLKLEIGAAGVSSDRIGFEGRKAGPDPWFDGNNYRATIVVTPARGTTIGQRKEDHDWLGLMGDLSDDAVVKIVRDELEYGWFGGKTANATVIDVPTTRRGKEQEDPVKIIEAQKRELKEHFLRFVSAELKGNPDLTSLVVATHIGRTIGPFLEHAGVGTLPEDFERRHLLVYPDRVIVWNRNGIAIAYIAEGTQEMPDQLRKVVVQLAEVLKKLDELISVPRTRQRQRQRQRQGFSCLNR